MLNKIANHSMVSHYADFEGLARLKYAAREKSPEALLETARQFEGLFIKMMLKSMRQTLSGDSIFDSEQVKFYQGMFDEQIALDLARRNSIGLAEFLYQQLGGNEGKVPQPQSLNHPYAAFPILPSSHTNAGLATEKVSVDKNNETDFIDKLAQSPEQFTKTLWPYAKKAAQALGVAPEVLIAQSALETGWGKSIIHNPQGESSHNLFAIKADRAWQGPRVNVSTVEYDDGIAVRQGAQFRAYATLEASFTDYVDFLRSNPRYQQALAHAHDSNAYLAELQKAGYATDPHYADKIRSILSGRYYADTVSRLKQS